MTFGPHDADIPRRQELSTDELTAVARVTGQRLVDDLQRADVLSLKWRDDKIGYPLLASAMNRALASLAATGCWGKDNQLPSGEFWAAAGSLLDVSWLQHRARFKPRGYAGDYEMFDRFWRRECSEHPLGRLFDHYFQGQAAVEAVRARTEQIAATLIEHCVASPPDRPYHIVSVGCGPAIDVQLAIDALPEARRRRLRITLLDLDESALDHARQRLSPVIDGSHVITLRENLFRLADKPRIADVLGGADFLFCSGLFDYLPDDAAEKMLRLFWRSLSDCGVLVVGNFAPHNPTRAYMEWLGNWYLIYRTAGQLEQLACSVGLSQSSYAIGAERMGVDLFLTATGKKLC